MWKNTADSGDWKKNLLQKKNEIQKNGVSLYIHLPFCEQLCTYCGCNKRITVNHQVEKPYIDSLLREWQYYIEIFGNTTIRQLHLGGGTPTFFSPSRLDYLLSELLKHAKLSEDFQGSVEIHPHFSRKEHLETLRKFRFDRISIGIQDFDENVQKAINRTQHFSEVEYLTTSARNLGYKSVNYDLIYGLPFQTRQGLSSTMDLVLRLKPDRIAFYSYAHVPWMKASQRKFTEKDLPDAYQKTELYLLGRSRLLDAGFQEVGMDHFAHPSDELFIARQNQTLTRNFMGYTVMLSPFLIGLGASSISDSGDMYIQNLREVEPYQEGVNVDIPVFRSHVLTEEEKCFRKHILNILCYFKTNWQPEDFFPQRMKNNPTWDTILKYGLVKCSDNELEVTDTGKLFVRNICYALDTESRLHEMAQPVYSKAI